MRWIKNLVIVILVVLVVMTGFFLAIDNPLPVSVTFLTFATPPYPVFAWLIAVFIAGVGVGFGACFFGFVRGKTKERQLRRDLGRSQRALDQVRGDQSA